MGTSPLQFRLSRSAVGSLSAGLAVLLALSSFAPAQDPAAGSKQLEEIARPRASGDLHFKMLGTLSCSSVNCHGGQSSSNARVRKSEEIHHWLANDPHAGARDLLDSLRYQTILNVVAAGQDRAQVQSRCNQCHDPAGASELGNYTLAQAISCETCHGNAEKWIGKHFERGVSRAQLTALGMTDTKNLADRAAVCAKYHFGSADHDINLD